MIPIFNEHKCATYMNNGEANDRSQDDPRAYQFRELVIYAKWLRWSLWANLPDGLDKDQLVYNGFITFCEQLLSGFNIDVDYKMVLDVMKKSKQIKLRQCNPSYITHKEWEQVMSLPDDRSRRLYFALLVLCKFNRNNPVLNVNEQEKNYEDTRFKIKIGRQDIYKYAGIKFKKAEIRENESIVVQPYATLGKSGLLEAKWGRGRCTLILTQADVDIDPVDNCDEIYMKITNYDCFEEYYQYGLKEKGYKICTRCGAAFKVSGSKNYDKLCKECKKHTEEYTYRHCEVCGTRFKVTHGNQSNKCKQCQYEDVKIRNLQSVKKYQDKICGKRNDI